MRTIPVIPRTMQACLGEEVADGVAGNELCGGVVFKITQADQDEAGLEWRVFK